MMYYVTFGSFDTAGVGVKSLSLCSLVLVRYLCSFSSLDVFRSAWLYGLLPACVQVALFLCLVFKHGRRKQQKAE